MILPAPQPRVLVAPDKFRGTATALEATRWLSEGLGTQLHPDLITAMPVADGGEGTIDCFVAAGFKTRSVLVSGPLGQPTPASIAVRGNVAIIEAAQACGLSLLTPAPATALAASSLGVGQLIRHALDLGHTDIVVAVGGTASTDGGAGLLQALGARMADSHGRELPPGGGSLPSLATVDLTQLDPRLRACRLTVAADVTTPLLGPSGAAGIYGPQKGAGKAEIATLERGLHAFALAMAVATGTQPAGAATAGTGGGAGGGIAWSLRTVVNARRASGADTILDLIGFDSAAQDAGLVLTGEGAAGIDAVYELVALAGSRKRSMAATPDLLRQAGRHIARARTAASGRPRSPERGRE